MNQKEINKIVQNLQKYLSENILLKEDGSIRHIKFLDNAESKKRSLIQESFAKCSVFRNYSDFDNVLEESTFDFIQNKIKNLFSNTESTFQERLFEIIRERKIDEVELYTKAQITKQTFSKIRSNRDYKPTKNTAFLLVLALNLNLEEAGNLLSRAGIAFSPSDKFDLAIKFFIENKIYDIFEINEILMQSGIKTLAG